MPSLLAYQFIIILLLSVTWTQATSAANFTISDCTQLESIADMSATYELTGNIDCSASVGWNGGAGFNPIGNFGSRFTGTFNGNNFTIDGLFIDRSTTDHQALFGYTENANISNVNLTNADISAQAESGILIGASVDTVVDDISISDSQITGTVSTAAISGKTDGINSNFSNLSFNNVFLTSPDSAGLVSGLVSDLTVANVSGSNLFLTLEDFSGGLLGQVTRTNINNVNLSQVNITSYNTRANKMGGIVGVADQDSEITDVTIDHLDIDATDATTKGDDVAGIAGRINNGSIVDNCHITNLVINGTDEVAGLVSSVLNNNADANNKTIVSNSDIKNINITGNIGVAGFIRRAREYCLVENCFVEDLTLTMNTENGGGFISRLENAFHVKNCYLKNANLTFNGNFAGGFARGAASGGLLEKCYIENVTIRGTASDNVSGFLGFIDVSDVKECFVKGLDLELNNTARAGGFTTWISNAASEVSHCYVVDSDIKAFRGDNTGRASCFADIILNGASLNEAFCSATVDGDLEDNFIFNNSATVDKIFFDDSKNSFPRNDSAAVALTDNDFQDLSNFTGFDPAIWLDGSQHPILKNLQQDLSNNVNKILVSFTEVFPFLPKNTILTDVNILTEFDAGDFNLEITSGGENVLLQGKKLLTNRIYDRGERFTVELKATNSDNQSILSRHNFKVKNFSFNDERDFIPDPKPEPPAPPIEEEENCLTEIKQYLGYTNDEEISKADLIDLVFLARDTENPVLNIATEDIFSCELIEEDLQQINKDLARLPLNSKGRLNFKAYRNFTRNFKRALRAQDSISCENLNYDFNQDCKLTSTDFKHFKQFFTISISQRRKDSVVNRRLNEIEYRRRLNRFISLD